MKVCNLSNHMMLVRWGLCGLLPLDALIMLALQKEIRHCPAKKKKKSTYILGEVVSLIIQISVRKGQGQETTSWMCVTFEPLGSTA